MINWTGVDAVATSITLLVITATAIFVYRQLKELRIQRQLSAVLDLYDKPNDDTAREARKLIYNLESTTELVGQADVRGKIEHHLNGLNQLLTSLRITFSPPIRR